MQSVAEKNNNSFEPLNTVSFAIMPTKDIDEVVKGWGVITEGKIGFVFSGGKVVAGEDVMTLSQLT